jgi:hypothetical protein
MAYDLVHVNTGEVIRGYRTLRGARIGMTVANRNAGWRRGIWCETGGVEMRWSQPRAGGPHWWAPYGIRRPAWVWTGATIETVA